MIIKKEQGIYYSKLWNIIEFKEWANLIISFVKIIYKLSLPIVGRHFIHLYVDL